MKKEKKKKEGFNGTDLVARTKPPSICVENTRHLLGLSAILSVHYRRTSSTSASSGYFVPRDSSNYSGRDIQYEFCSGPLYNPLKLCLTFVFSLPCCFSSTRSSVCRYAFFGILNSRSFSYSYPPRFPEIRDRDKEKKRPRRKKMNRSRSQ